MLRNVLVKYKILDAKMLILKYKLTKMLDNSECQNAKYIASK
jgi:hypothetical protein